MTAMLSGMPNPLGGPERPLPGGRDERREQEREARRLAVRLAAAQRRLGQPGPTSPALTVAVVEDIAELAEATSDSRKRGARQRVWALWRPRRGRS